MVAQRKAKETDNYDLQPDELTFEQLVEKAKKHGVNSSRGVGKWLEKGLIPYDTAKRRNAAGQISDMRIFKTADVEEFFENRKHGKKSPKVEKPVREETQMQTNEQTQNFSPENLLNFMNQFAERMQPPPKSVLMELSGKIFISLDELAQFSGIAKSRLEPAVKSAQENGTLQHFTGERGKSVYKCVELDFVIENLPPTPKQLREPPKPKDKK